MNVFLDLLLALIALSLAWRCWKRTILAYTRDRLFDLRDEWRAFWLSSGRDLSDPDYARIRHAINRYLHYTKSVRFVGLIAITSYDARRGHAMPPRQTPLSTSLADPVADKERVRIMQGAVLAIQVYMFMTSLLIVPILLIALFEILRRHTFKIGAGIKSASIKFSEKVKYLHPDIIDTAVETAA